MNQESPESWLKRTIAAAEAVGFDPKDVEIADDGGTMKPGDENFRENDLKSRAGSGGARIGKKPGMKAPEKKTEQIG